MEILGIDIGGTGIKGAPVNIETGTLIAPRHRIRTPKSGEPQPMAKVVGEIAKHFDWKGPIGVGFPAIIKHGVAHSAANVSDEWIGTNAEELIAGVTGCPVTVINDADAAGLAEMTFGAGKGRMGSVFIITIGTGIGSALFYDGVLVPNTELGHLEFDGKEAEAYASDAVREAKEMSWKKWAKRFDAYLHTLDALFSPDLFILGGGASKNHAEFMQYLTVNVEVAPASMLNEAGIVGAAMAARPK